MGLDWSQSDSIGVISFIGVIGSGKDHNAEAWEALGRTRIPFKDPLIDMCSDIAGYDIRENYDWFKEAIVGVRCPANPLHRGIVMQEMKELIAKYPEIMTGRKLLTNVGTDAMRKRNPDYWVDQWMTVSVRTLAEGTFIVNADCRFFNEVTAIRRLALGCVNKPLTSRFVFTNFKSHRYDAKLDHPSEKLAQTLLAMGLEDDQEITDDHFTEAARRMGETYVIDRRAPEGAGAQP